MAKIQPLEGKYYGTKVEVNVGGELHDITIWTPDHFAKPFASPRYMALDWSPEDGHDHVEDVASYRIAQIIAEALTKEGY